MSNDNIVPISTTKRPVASVARTETGESVSVADCEDMLAAHLGFEADLIVSESTFSVTMTYLDGLVPDTKFDLFVVVSDNGFPFLLGGSMTSWGMDVRYNTYINPLLERDLRDIALVDVTEIGGDVRRVYQVPLRHCFE